MLDFHCLNHPLRTAALVAFMSLVNQLPTHAVAADTPASRWHSTLEEFAAADKVKKPSGRGLLFVGSSTIRTSHLRCWCRPVKTTCKKAAPQRRSLPA